MAGLGAILLFFAIGPIVFAYLIAKALPMRPLWFAILISTLPFAFLTYSTREYWGACGHSFKTNHIKCPDLRALEIEVMAFLEFCIGTVSSLFFFRRGNRK